MVHEQPVKTRNLKMRNLERADTPQELAEADALQVVGGGFLSDVMVESLVPKKDATSLGLSH